MACTRSLGRACALAVAALAFYFSELHGRQQENYDRMRCMRDEEQLTKMLPVPITAP